MNSVETTLRTIISVTQLVTRMLAILEEVAENLCLVMKVLYPTGMHRPVSLAKVKKTIKL